MSSSETKELNVQGNSTCGPSNIISDLFNTVGSKIDNTGNLVNMEKNVVTGDMNVYCNFKAECKKVFSVQYRVPLSKDKVIGRENDVKELFKLISLKKRICITGMGGVGKSTLALHCAGIWLTEHKNLIQNIAVINSESEHSYKKSIESFATSLDIKPKNKDLLTTLKAVFNYFEDSSLLMVYDNVDSVEFLKDYLPDDSYGHVYIIATSQLTEIDEFFHCYPLKVLSEEDSILLLESVLTNKSYNKEDLKTLVELLGFLPVAILLAAAFIKDTVRENENYHVQDYIKNFSQLMKKPFPKNFKNNYKQTVYNCLLQNINKIDLECTKTILKCIAYMNPTEIDMKMFQEVFSEEEINKAIRELKFSIITEHINELIERKYFTIHRLIQEVCRELDKNETSLCLCLQLLLLTESYSDHMSFLESYVKEHHLKEAYLEYLKNPKNIEKLQDVLNVVDCNLSVTKNWPTAYYAAFFNHRNVVDFFFNRGFNKKHVCSNGWTILHVAMLRLLPMYFSNVVYNYDHDLLSMYYRRRDYYKFYDPNNISQQTSTGLTALHIASARGLSPYVEGLLDCGLNVDVQDEKGNAAIHWAARYKCVEVLKILVESGARCEVVNNNGETFCDILCQEDVEESFDFGTFRCTLYGSVLKCKTLSGDETQMLIAWQKLNNMDDCFKFIADYKYDTLEYESTEQYRSYDHLMFDKQKQKINIEQFLQENEEKLKELILYFDFDICALILLKLIMLSKSISVERLLELTEKRDTAIPGHIPGNVFKLICLVLDSFELQYSDDYDAMIHGYISGQCIKYSDEDLENGITLLWVRLTHDQQDCISELDRSLIKFLMDGTSSLVYCAVIHRASQISHVWKYVLAEVLTEELEQKLNFSRDDIPVLMFFSIQSIHQFYLQSSRNLNTSRLRNKLKEDNIIIPNVESWPTLWFTTCDERETSIYISTRLIRLGVNVNEQFYDLFPLDIAIVLENTKMEALLKTWGATSDKYSPSAQNNIDTQFSPTRMYWENVLDGI